MTTTPLWRCHRIKTWTEPFLCRLAIAFEAGSYRIPSASWPENNGPSGRCIHISHSRTPWPGLMDLRLRISSICLELKFDIPMDPTRPRVTSFSRANQVSVGWRVSSKMKSPYFGFGSSPAWKATGQVKVEVVKAQGGSFSFYFHLVCWSSAWKNVLWEWIFIKQFFHLCCVLCYNMYIYER